MLDNDFKLIVWSVIQISQLDLNWSVSFVDVIRAEASDLKVRIFGNDRRAGDYVYRDIVLPHIDLKRHLAEIH